MATDGGQVKIGNKVYAEQNHSQTCVTSSTLTIYKCIITNGVRNFILHPANQKGILITDANGNATFVAVPEGIAGQNKLLATDNSGNLVWIDK